MRSILTIVTILTAVQASAAEGDWVYLPGEFTHDPYTGHRVTQFAPDAVAVYPFGRNYQKSGFRYSNSTLRIGNSVDRYTTVESWGNGAAALGATMLFQPYDDRGDDTVGPADYRRHRRRLHEDWHDVHRRHRMYDRDMDDYGDGERHRRGRGRYHEGHGVAPWADDSIGWGGWGSPQYGPGGGPAWRGGPRGPGVWPGNGWGGNGWGGWGAGFGTGFSAAGSAANHGRVTWDKDSGSVEWGLDRNYYRDGYTYGYGAPWHGGGYRGHHRPRPVPHGNRR